MKYKFCPKCRGDLIKYSEHNQVVSQCSECDFLFFQNSKPTVSALIVDGNRLLLGKRRKEPFKGMWDVIGGFLNYGEHPYDGLKREVKEETGLDIEIEKCLGFFMDVYGKDQDSTMNICFLCKSTGGIEKPGDDIGELRWFAKDEIPKAEIAFKNGQEMVQTWLETLHR